MWRAATFKPPPLWRKGRLWGGRAVLPVATAMVHVWSAASATWYPARWSRRVSVSGPKKLGWLAGGGAAGAAGRSRCWGLGAPAVGAVGEAVRGSQADPVVWVPGQGRLW